MDLMGWESIHTVESLALNALLVDARGGEYGAGDEEDASGVSSE